MKKSILFFFQSLLIFFLFSFLFSCSVNDEPISEENSLLNEIKTRFNPNTFTDLGGGANWDIEWDNFDELTRDSTQIYTFALKEKNETKIQSDLFQEKVIHQLIGFKKGKKTAIYLLEVKSNHQSSIYTNDITHIENFSGIASVYDLNGNHLGAITFTAGKANNYSQIKELNDIAKIFNLFYTPKLTTKIPMCTVTVMIYDLRYVEIYTSYTDKNGVVRDFAFRERILRSVSVSPTTVNYPCDSPINTDEKYVVYKSLIYNYKELNPCTTKDFIKSITQSNGYQSATTAISNASTDGLEHSITLGKDANGNITQAPMNSGGPVNVKVNTSWAGAFGAIHNHTNKTPISGGDIYAAVTLNSNNSNFTTTFVSTDGEMYAAVVTDLAAAKAFVAAYPADISTGYNPEFPDFILDQIDYIQAYNTGSTITGRTDALAFILNKYNAGITLLKQDSSGNFNPIIITETTNPDGSKTYSSTPCN